MTQELAQDLRRELDATRHSLLLRAETGEEAAWRRLADLYRPLLVGYLLKHSVPRHELDDLVQEILLALVQGLPAFRHSGRTGAFRAWLRGITCNLTCDFWKTRGRQAHPLGEPGVAEAVQRLEDPNNELNRQFEEEHDRYVIRFLIDLMETEFEPATIQAFRRLTLDGAPGAVVAQELGVSVGAVYVAKSRVLNRLRQEASGLLDSEYL